MKARHALRSLRERTHTRLLGGEEPDPRFTLANERTYLAWIRTSLALLGGAIAVEAFTQQTFSPEARRLMVDCLLILAGLLSLGSVLRWLNVERALRHRRPLPLARIIPLLSLGCAGTALLLTWYL